MKATGRTGDRERATRKRAGKSVLMMPTHPRAESFIYPPFLLEKKEIVSINRGSFNNMGWGGAKGETRKDKLYRHRLTLVGSAHVPASPERGQLTLIDSFSFSTGFLFTKEKV